MRWQAALTIGPCRLTSCAHAASLKGSAQSPARCGAAGGLLPLVLLVTQSYCRTRGKIAKNLSRLRFHTGSCSSFCGGENVRAAKPQLKNHRAAHMHISVKADGHQRLA